MANYKRGRPGKYKKAYEDYERSEDERRNRGTTPQVQEQETSRPPRKKKKRKYLIERRLKPEVCARMKKQGLLVDCDEWQAHKYYVHKKARDEALKQLRHKSKQTLTTGYVMEHYEYRSVDLD